MRGAKMLLAAVLAANLLATAVGEPRSLLRAEGSSSSATARTLLATYTASAPGQDCTGTDLQSCYGYGQYRVAGQGTYAGCAQFCDACSGCTGFGISNNGCWLKKTTGMTALANSVCYRNLAATTTPSSPPPSTAVVVYTSAGSNLDCAGTDLQSCYGYGQYSIAGQGTYAFCAQSCTACSGCTGFGISNNGCWLKKTTGTKALANSQCYLAPSAAVAASPPPSTAVVVYTSAGSGLDCTGTDLQSCYGYGQYSIAGQGTYAFCAQSCTACSGCTGFGISNNGCWLKKTTGTKALANSVCYLAPSVAVAAVASPPPPPPAVVYTNVGSGLDCTGTDLQSCYGYGQYSIAGQGTYAFCAQSCTACSGCTGFGISNNGCWLKKTTGTKALANSVCYLAPSAVPPPVASPPPTRPPPPPTVVYQSAGSNVDCSGLDLQSCYGYGQYSIAGQGTYVFCAQSCTACNGCTGFGISNNGCWLKKTSGIHALTNSQCWLAPSAMAALPSPSPPPPPPSPSPPPPPSPSPPPPPSPSPPPPPTIYTSQHVLDAAASSGFTGKVIGGPTTHVINNGATTSSTETTASGKQNVWETTSTSDATQQGLGNGQTLSKSSTSSTTDTDHQLTFKKVNVHSSTTDIDGKPADVPTAPPLCGGTPFAVANTMKQLCLHVKGGINNGGFVVANVKRPVITAACSQGSPNQQFTWLPAPEGGMLMHDATKQVLALTSATVTNGAAVILAPASDALTEEWVWNNPTTGGTLSAMADPYFQITDSQVNANVAVGLPVHMWHLASSLPSGQPKAAWMASCDK